MKKESFPNRKRAKKVSFTLDDYDALSRLLAYGYDIQTALQVITTKRNSKRIQMIHNVLSQGESICDHLIDIPQLSIHFTFFYQYTSLDQALAQSLGMYRYEQQIKRDIIDSCLYPCIVMGVCVVCFLVMVVYILPMMLELLASMDMELNATLLLVVRSVSVLLMIGIILCIGGAIVIRWQLSQKNQLAFFQFLNKHIQDHILKFFHCYLWAGYWQEFQRQSCSTVDALGYLAQMDYRPLTQHCALLIDCKLKQGTPIIDAMKETAMFHESLCFHFDVGMKCQQLDVFLATYMEESRKKIHKTTKRLMHVLQFGSYAFVGLIVALMSQILFAPMDLLASLA